MANSYNDDENLHKLFKHFIHDLRSPLSGLKMLLHALSGRLSEDEKNAIDKAYERIGNTVSITAQALNKNNVVTTSFNINSVIQDMIQEKKVEYMGHDVKFTYKAPENYQDINIVGVQNDFCRMLSNLINNAIDACNNKSGTVRIGLHKSNNVITLSVNDDGHGIPGEILQKLRDGETITYAKKDGHGYGMSQIRDTITKLKGNLDIESKFGGGTKISIRFELDK